MATVERRHREKACEVLLMGISDQVLHYIDTGETPDSDLDEDGICDGVHGVALAIADAEQRGREAGKAEERADVIATIERCRSIVTAAGLGRPGPLMQGRALALNDLHGIIGSGEHVGAARQQGGG